MEILTTLIREVAAAHQRASAVPPPAITTIIDATAPPKVQRGQAYTRRREEAEQAAFQQAQQLTTTRLAAAQAALELAQLLLDSTLDPPTQHQAMDALLPTLQHWRVQELGWFDETTVTRTYDVGVDAAGKPVTEPRTFGPYRKYRWHDGKRVRTYTRGHRDRLPADEREQPWLFLRQWPALTTAALVEPPAVLQSAMLREKEELPLNIETEEGASLMPLTGLAMLRGKDQEAHNIVGDVQLRILASSQPLAATALAQLRQALGPALSVSSDVQHGRKRSDEWLAYLTLAIAAPAPVPRTLDDALASLAVLRADLRRQLEASLRHTTIRLRAGRSALTLVEDALTLWDELMPIHAVAEELLRTHRDETHLQEKIAGVLTMVRLNPRRRDLAARQQHLARQLEAARGLNTADSIELRRLLRELDVELVILAQIQEYRTRLADQGVRLEHYLSAIPAPHEVPASESAPAAAAPEAAVPSRSRRARERTAWLPVDKMSDLSDVDLELAGGRRWQRWFGKGESKLQQRLVERIYFDPATWLERAASSNARLWYDVMADRWCWKALDIAEAKQMILAIRQKAVQRKTKGRSEERKHWKVASCGHIEHTSVAARYGSRCYYCALGWPVQDG